MGAQDVQVPNLVTAVECIKLSSMNPYHCFPLCRVVTKTHFSQDQRKELEGDAKMIRLVSADVSPRIRERQVRIIGNFCCYTQSETNVIPIITTISCPIFVSKHKVKKRTQKEKGKNCINLISEFKVHQYLDK